MGIVTSYSLILRKAPAGQCIPSSQLLTWFREQARHWRSVEQTLDSAIISCSAPANTGDRISNHPLCSGLHVPRIHHRCALDGAHGFVTLVVGVPCFYPSLFLYLVCRPENCSRESKYHHSNQFHIFASPPENVRQLLMNGWSVKKSLLVRYLLCSEIT